MKTIWKWTLVGNTEIDMPIGAEILAVQVQHGYPQLWALVDPNAPKAKRLFMAYGTGHDIPDDPGRHLGTFQLMGGNLVLHVFEVK